MKLFRRVWYSALVVFLLLAGCGTGGKPAVGVSGRILDHTRPYVAPAQNLPPGDKGLRVTFINADAAQYPAVVDPTEGSFTVPGDEGRGIPPGTYRIAVGVGAMGQPDLFKDAFSEQKSPLTVEISKSCEVVVDIGTRKATVQ
jgi:hypothetical protein